MVVSILPGDLRATQPPDKAGAQVRDCAAKSVVISLAHGQHEEKVVEIENCSSAKLVENTLGWGKI